ncbi:hypothetical protein [Salinibacterium sp. PAMC 21357]|uniref:hypothetical protein n=1 Tax=Salinibacterium sp. PAMC 21357 TaxID=1112215 RepID=UPI0002883969|nr:hypothetical protein [Salinibacterium sp. PAMC 21357]
MTILSIEKTHFLIDGKVVNAGRRLGDIPLDGLLLNSRMINGIFDDLTPETRKNWVYPDTGVWDPDRNTDEFIAAMPQWRADGLDAFTVGVQGGSPFGYSKEQAWDSGGYDPDGSLRPASFERLRRILNAADDLGFAVILDLFYQGQEMRLIDDAAVRRAVVASADFILEGGWRNVAIEIANECNLPHEYTHSRLMRAENVHELISLAQSVEREGRRLLVSSSFVDMRHAKDNPEVVFVTNETLAVADFVLLHGNGTKTPHVVVEGAEELKAMPGYREVPIIINEDDHFEFDADDNHMKAALRAGISWGYFDPGSETTWPDPQSTPGDYENGFQSVPINWGASSELKRRFFGELRSVR